MRTRKEIEDSLRSQTFLLIRHEGGHEDFEGENISGIVEDSVNQNARNEAIVELLLDIRELLAYIAYVKR